MDAADFRQGDLFRALVDLCNGFGAVGDVECRVALGAAHLRFPAPLCAVLYQAVRELLNVRQHARASAVEIGSSAARDGSIRLCVADDGIGLTRHWREATPFAAGSGIGLWSIDQRLRAFGAYLDVESGANGTRAVLVIPGRLRAGG